MKPNVPSRYYPAARVSGLFMSLGGILGGVVLTCINWSAGNHITLATLIKVCGQGMVAGLPPAMTVGMLAVGLQARRSFPHIAVLSGIGAGISFLYMCLLMISNDRMAQHDAWPQIFIVGLVGAITTVLMALMVLPEQD